MELKDKVVLVTGASKGIGSAIAVAFAQAGAKVIINYRSDTVAAEETLKLCGKGEHLLIKADVSKEAEVLSMFAVLKKKFAALDILVNNAGSGNSNDFNAPLSDWKMLMDNNFFSTVIVSREFLIFGSPTKLRKIINISSIYGFDDKSNMSFMAYSAAKAAQNSFTKNLAKKFAPNVLVNAIAPGYVMTPGWGEMTEAEIETNSNEQLIQRFIKPEEIAETAVMLGKNDSFTGSIFIQDGGLNLKTVQ